MNLLLDQGLPLSCGAILRESGFDAIHVSEIGMAEAEDDAILERAKVEHRVVVTLDSDFHTLLVLNSSTAPSVIRIRSQGMKALDAATLIQWVVKHSELALARGAMVSVHHGSIRIRRLPMTSGDQL